MGMATERPAGRVTAAPGRWTYLLSLAAVVVFVVSIVVSGARLAEMEQDIARGVPENLVWMAAQAQFEAVRLADAVGRHAAGDPEVDAEVLRTRFDVLLSRIDILHQGKPGEYLLELGEGSAVAAVLRDATAIEARVGEALLGVPTAAEALRHQAHGLAMTLRDMTNRVMLADRSRSLELADRRRQVMLELLAYGVGILASGTVLALSLLRGLRHRAAAEAELARHRDHLEDMVAARTADVLAAEERLVSAIDTAPDGFAAYGPDGRLVHANGGIQTLLPARRGLFAAGARLSVLAAELAALGVPGLIEAHDDTDVDVRLPEDRWCRVSIRRMPDGGTVVRVADVTPYIHATQALEQALARAQGLTDLYRSFVSMVSHQFRTPMAIIDAAAQRLLRRADSIPPEELRDRAGKIRSAVLRLTALMDSTLNAARLDAGELAVEPQPSDLAALLRFVAERQREIAPDRAVVVDLAGLPALVRMDATMMEQALANLVSNAVKYSAAPTAVEIRAVAVGTDVTVSVRDHGVGIPSDELPRLFERFFRARTASGIAGTGIGLAFARHIVRLHGGDITVESREGEGSTFTVRLPGAAVAPAPATAGAPGHLQGVDGE
ncbi:His Kinase A (phospho-acceptor) domain-containing protein [Caenispirillum bisanense]|uniref:histidine kinase n=1 Tax=Caenispirillum bisanense TaxID=414052 RepID=A0A286GRI8_9PROT|nr:His Kinase A (phospho-acceptor) domain-containing protein [Caenispirillum bisanense]